MADLPIPQNWDVEPPTEVQRKWWDVRIQEFRSRIAKTKQMIEDIIQGQVVKLEADLTMLQLSLEDLEKKRDAIILDKKED